MGYIQGTVMICDGFLSTNTDSEHCHSALKVALKKQTSLEGAGRNCRVMNKNSDFSLSGR